MKKPALELVLLENSDLEEVFELDRVCFPGKLAFPKHLFSFLLNSPDCLCLAAKDQGRLAGFVIAQAINTSKAQLVTLDIAPAWRRKSLAKRLLLTVHAFFQEHGFRSMVLEVAVNNKSAISLYEKLGYHRLGVQKHYYPDGTDALKMEKTLQG
jgi:ribosomal-protein-alanine N-acetyltransferase